MHLLEHLGWSHALGVKNAAFWQFVTAVTGYYPPDVDSIGGIDGKSNLYFSSMELEPTLL